MTLAYQKGRELGAWTQAREGVQSKQGRPNGRRSCYPPGEARKARVFSHAP